MMHLLGSYLEGRISALSPQNVSNIAHACAKLECYNHELFHGLQERVASENLASYKLFELSILSHSLAKLGCGGARIYKALFDELAMRSNWEPHSVAQVLDAMRRKRMHQHETLLCNLLQHFVERLQEYKVHPLTQAAWCLVELDALDMAAEIPSTL